MSVYVVDRQPWSPSHWSTMADRDRGQEPAFAWVMRILVDIDAEALPLRLRSALLALVSYADHDGSNAYPSAATIGRCLGVSESTAGRWLRRLEAIDIVERTAVKSLGEHARRVVRRIDRNALLNLTAEPPFKVTARNIDQQTAEPSPRGSRTVTQGDGDHPRPSRIDTLASLACRETPENAASESTTESDTDDDQEDAPVEQLSITGTDDDTQAKVVRITDGEPDPFASTWEALADLFGHPTPSGKTLRAKVAHELVSVGADGSEVRRRAAAIVAWLGSTDYLTPTSLLKHWPRFDGQVSRITADDIGAVRQQERREEIDAAKARLEAEGPWGIGASE